MNIHPAMIETSAGLCRAARVKQHAIGGDTPRQLMSNLGLMPGERSAGDAIRRLGIAKAGNARVRRLLVESVWSYRHVPWTSELKHYVIERVSPAVDDIALTAQELLCVRCAAVSGGGKKLTVDVTVIMTLP